MLNREEASSWLVKKLARKREEEVTEILSCLTRHSSTRGKVLARSRPGPSRGLEPATLVILLVHFTTELSVLE